jgi:mutator protein MutT
MAEQIFQVGIKALIQNESNEIFMLHVPAWQHNKAHWDLPGGRMDTGETFLETLKRELKEELGVSYSGQPTQLMAMLTNITILVENKLLPLMFVIYLVKLENSGKIKLSSDTHEDDSGWFVPAKAADLMAYKFTPEFCDLVRSLGT